MSQVFAVREKKKQQLSSDRTSRLAKRSQAAVVEEVKSSKKSKNGKK